jgi:hypothetical protein
VVDDRVPQARSLYAPAALERMHSILNRPAVANRLRRFKRIRGVTISESLINGNSPASQSIRQFGHHGIKSPSRS